MVNGDIMMQGKLIIAAGALAILTGTAQARDDLMALAFPDKAPGCFRRSYDAAHLAANRDQSVVAITLSRGAPQLKREAIDGPEAPQRALALSVRLRGGGKAGPEPLDCHDRQAKEADHGGREFFQCSSLCGRGHVDIVPQSRNRVLISIGGTVEGRFLPDAVGLGQSCRSDAGVAWLGDAAGDRAFVLDRVPAKECR